MLAAVASAGRRRRSVSCRASNRESRGAAPAVFPRLRRIRGSPRAAGPGLRCRLARRDSGCASRRESSARSPDHRRPACGVSACCSIRTLLDDPSAYQVLLDDPFKRRRIAFPIPGAFGIDQGDRTAFADAQTIRFRAQNTALFRKAKLLRRFLRNFHAASPRSRHSIWAWFDRSTEKYAAWRRSRRRCRRFLVEFGHAFLFVGTDVQAERRRLGPQQNRRSIDVTPATTCR